MVDRPFVVRVGVRSTHSDFPGDLRMVLVPLTQAHLGITQVQVFAKRNDYRVFVVITWESEEKYRTARVDGTWEKEIVPLLQQYDGTIFVVTETNEILPGWAEVT